ncbi:MAG: nitroreductase family protein [Deltaproteobacteria bacterium]|nr:nitroreductase family protein [Deltaproteobacteria bacterium]MBI3293965.1 nitroreductase family protein [Deltaproteobacteria bacterium]
MNSTIRVLKGHRSIRRYKRKAIAVRVLDEVIECGLRASSSGNLNTWSVVVTTKKDLKKRLYHLHKEQEMVLEAPVVLTVCADFRRTRRWIKLRKARDAFDDFTSFMVAAVDATLAAQNMTIAAESLGLGVCYMGTTLWSAPGISKLLRLPDNVVPITSLVVGYPAENPAVRGRLPRDFLVHRERYQELADRALLKSFGEREESGWERYRSMPTVLREIERRGIKSLAEYYTSDAKYPKSLHRRTSREYLALLKRKKFWNH